MILPSNAQAGIGTISATVVSDIISIGPEGTTIPDGVYYYCESDVNGTVCFF